MIKRVRSHHYFMLDYLKALCRALFRPAMIFLFFLSTSLILAFSFLFFYLERFENNNITKFLDSLYYIVTIFTGAGLGDIVPVTQEGRILSMFVMFIGTAIYVSLAGVVAATIIELEAERRK